MMDYHIAIDRLVPGANYRRAGTYAELEATWHDGRGLPSDAALQAEYGLWVAEQAAVAQRESDADAVRQAKNAVAFLQNKTPAEIKAYMEGQVDGWSTLADAKADLRSWMTILAQVIAYLVD